MICNTQRDDRTYVADIIQSIQLRGEATMNAEELLVHDSRKGQCAEGIHACFIYSL